MVMDIKKPEQLLLIFSEFLAGREFDRPPHSLYEPVSYIMALGGKRLRPGLALMGCQLFGRPVEDALHAALAVEIFHNFSLLHDDIMDQAPLRRGKPTVHERYGINAGILSGDVMLIEAYRQLCQCPSDAPLDRLLAIFNQMAIEVCEGQALDMDFEHRNDVTLPEYLRMIEEKTAALIGAGLSLGAVIGGADQEAQFHIDAFGRNIGIAFQIQDDLLDTFGDPGQFGKKTGGDIARNKKTFLVLKAMELANPEQQQMLNNLFHENHLPETEKIDAVKNLFIQLNIPQLAEKTKSEFQQTAIIHLQAIQKPDEYKEPIRDFADMLFSRQT